jgi:hypothetical protein
LDGCIRWLISTVIIVLFDLVITHSLVAFFILGILIQSHDDTAKVNDGEETVIDVKAPRKDRYGNESNSNIIPVEESDASDRQAEP